MSFIKKSNFSQKLNNEKLAALTDQERLQFPVGLKFSKGEGMQAKSWIVTESYKSGPDEYRRVHCMESEEDEVMLLNVLVKDATQAGFTFIKEG